MMVRRVLMLVLVAAVLANAALILDALTLGLWVPTADAQTLLPIEKELGAKEETPSQDAADGGVTTARETYERLIDELIAQREVLEKKARDLIERERQLEALRAEMRSERDAIDAARAELAKEREEYLSLDAPDFDRLLKAYEGMDPENAAAALAELYTRDRTVVIDVLLGLKARQAALTLDALAATHPQQAADLSLEIWKKDPKRSGGAGRRVR